MSLFISSSSVIDKEALQEYVAKKLTLLSEEARALMEARENDHFWQEFHAEIMKIKDEKERNKLVIVEDQLKKLPMYIDTWINMAVDTKERFDFFVMAKAREISSGDEAKDYFWAMQIRHDQMVALVRVLVSLTAHIESLIKTEPKKALKDPIIQGMMEYSIEDQVYLEAERVHDEREKLSK